MTVWFSGAGAQPQVVDAEVVLVEDGVLRLTGSGFGSKSPVAPALYDDFENGSDGAQIFGHPGSLWDGHFNGHHYTNPPTYDDSLSVDPGIGTCMRINHTLRESISWVWKTVEPTGEMYIDVKMKMIIYDEQYPENVKPWRLYRSSDSSRAQNVYPSFRKACDPTDVLNERAGGWGVDIPAVFDPGECWEDMGGRSGWSRPNGLVNVMDWATVQMLYGANTAPAADGYAAFYVNGRILSKLEYGEGTGMCWLERGGETYDMLGIGNMASPGNYGCGGASLGSRTYYDHVYLDTTFQRVEFGNAPIYDQCTRREIQIPTAWSPTQVTASVKLGSFEDFDNVYAFVVDGQNRASNGFPVRVTGDAGAPGTPGTPIREN
ncbi:MAG: hypothetical protein IH621_02150 [Krumholzibacteria bacterium]|nr:hypothetical protein [Candidatus Krumholzibacteria bacterium]